MTTFTVGLRTTPFDNIISNGKICEGRLYRSVFKDMKRNDIIIFKNHTNGKSRQIKVLIIDTQRFSTFMEMIQSIGIEYILPNTSIADSEYVYRKYYSEDKEKKYGVIAILFRVSD